MNSAGRITLRDRAAVEAAEYALEHKRASFQLRLARRSPVAPQPLRDLGACAMWELGCSRWDAGAGRVTCHIVLSVSVSNSTAVRPRVGCVRAERERKMQCYAQMREIYQILEQMRKISQQEQICKILDPLKNAYSCILHPPMVAVSLVPLLRRRASFLFIRIEMLQSFIN